MTIYQTITQSEFTTAFHRTGRGDNFSYSALCALYDYIDELSDATGEDIELDVIALCSEYSEYSDALEAAAEYGFTPEGDQEESEQEQSAIDWLRGRTQVIQFSGGVIIQDF